MGRVFDPSFDNDSCSGVAMEDIDMAELNDGDVPIIASTIIDVNSVSKSHDVTTLHCASTLVSPSKWALRSMSSLATTSSMNMTTLPISLRPFLHFSIGVQVDTSMLDV